MWINSDCNEHPAGCPSYCPNSSFSKAQREKSRKIRERIWNAACALIREIDDWDDKHLKELRNELERAVYYPLIAPCDQKGQMKLRGIK